MIITCDINIWWSHMRISHYGIWCWYMNFGIWYSHMIMSRAGIWCWYMMFNNPRFHYGIWWSHVNIICDHHIQQFSLLYVTSHVICEIFICEVGIWSSVYEVGIWSWYMNYGIWCWYMISHVNILGFGIWR